MESNQPETRSAAQAGWHLSRYNLSARVPGENKTAIANLYKGTVTEITIQEISLLAALDRLDENSPLLDYFKSQGILVNYDERAALETLSRRACAYPDYILLTICPTMGCNFDCPYCFENHRSGIMSEETQEDVTALAERMLDSSHAKLMYVTWYGGEPLLAPDVVRDLSARLMELAEKKGAVYEAGIITNGYLLNQHHADLLEKAKVRTIQITLDGIGPSHDATRHLAGGGPTFDRIIDNLRSVKLPGKVRIRHNMHEGNKAEAENLKALTSALAEESGNDLSYFPYPVMDNTASRQRGSDVSLLHHSTSSRMAMDTGIHHFGAGQGHFCTANLLWSVSIDDKGRLFKCMENVDKPELSFGTAGKWNPVELLKTADRPDLLTRYLNTAGALDDPECQECAWLPVCCGGCPHSRLFSEKNCLSYKDDPENFVLQLLAYRREQNAHRQQTDDTAVPQKKKNKKRLPGCPVSTYQSAGESC